MTESVISSEKEDMGNSQDNYKWFVMRVTYGRERKFADYLKTQDIRYFLPTRIIRYNRKSDGKMMKREVSVISNVIFVYDTREHIQELKNSENCKCLIRYMMDYSEKGKPKPMTVRKKHMEDFIRVAGTDEEALLYLDHPDVVLQKGQPVEILYGPFTGVRGYVMRIKRDRKVVLTLNGLIAAAITATIDPDWIKLLKE